MEQIDIFTEIARVSHTEEEQIKNDLGHAWPLYRVYRATAGRKLSDKELLEMLPEYEYAKEMAEFPNREFNNTSAVRWLRKDKKLIRHSVRIQKILCNGKLANTTEEASKFLRKKKIKALTLLKEYYEEMGKLALDGQQRLTFGQERDHIEAILKLESEFDKGGNK